MSEPYPIREWLFTLPDEPCTIRSIIAWWEKRRLFYNIFIGSIGFCSFILFLFFVWSADTLEPGEDAFEPIAIIFAPIFINICYTAGWVIEALAFRTEVGRRRLRGPFLLRVGLAFSLLVVLLPSVSWGIVLVIRLLR